MHHNHQAVATLKWLLYTTTYGLIRAQQLIALIRAVNSSVTKLGISNTSPAIPTRGFFRATRGGGAGSGRAILLILAECTVFHAITHPREGNAYA